MMLPKQALALIGLMALGALAVIGYALHTMRPLGGYRFWALVVLALATARLKVKLPRLTGNMAVNLPFLLIAVAELSLLEALLVALPSCGVQCFPTGRGNKPRLVQFLFNLSTTALAVAAASRIGTHFAVLGAAGFFLVQTVPLASIIHITEGGAIHQIWSSIAHYSFPFYVLSAGITRIVTTTAPQLSWQVPVLGLLVLYATYRSYRSYFHAPSPAHK